MNLTATVSSIAASGGIRPDSHITARPVTAIKAGPVALTLVAATLSVVLGGTTVAIAGVIEGQRSFLFRCSDLSPGSILSGGVEADPNSRNCFGNASNPLVVLGHAQRKTNTSLKTAINIAGVAPRPLNFPRGPLETRTLHDQKRLVSPARRCGNADPTLTGQRSYTDERERPSKRFGLMQGSRRAASRSGGVRMGDRNLGNPCAEKVGACRPRQNKGAAPLTKAPSAFRRIGGAVRRGTLTITGSNVRLGTEMPVALSSFSL